MEDKEIDVLFMKYLANHFEGEEALMFIGPDTGANNPAYFCHIQDLAGLYPRLKKILPTVRSTAGLYETPNRSLMGIVRAWCLAMDFDYDRGDWAGVKRSVQDMTLYEFCKWITPTATVQTGHGWHLYWVLDKPMSAADYAYPASLIKAQLKADTRSILPMQCLNFHNKNPRKPAVMVDGLNLESIGKFIPTFPNETYHYKVDDIIAALANHESESLRKLRQNMYAKYRSDSDRSYNEKRDRRKDETMSILEKIDIVGELNGAGYKAYSRGGGKVICCCPFHDDRHPSAYIDIDPHSDWFGMFCCTSSHCNKHTTLKRVLQEIGVSV